MVVRQGSCITIMYEVRNTVLEVKRRNLFVRTSLLILSLKTANEWEYRKWDSIPVLESRGKILKEEL